MKKIFLLLVIIYSIANATAQVKQEPILSPSWELTDINGIVHKFPENNNKNTIVLFWATWCPFCKKLMPHLQSILFQYADELNLQVFAMDIFEDDDQDVRVSQKLLDDNGYDFILFPKAEKVAQAYGVSGTPTLYIFNAKGELIFNMSKVDLKKLKLNDKDKNSKKAALLAPLWASEIRKSLVAQIKE
jgi:thiol-disulfide isomerase/thioredoxin